MNSDSENNQDTSIANSNMRELSLNEMKDVNGGWSWKHALSGAVIGGSVGGPKGAVAGAVMFGIFGGK